MSKVFIICKVWHYMEKIAPAVIGDNTDAVKDNDHLFSIGMPALITYANWIQGWSYMNPTRLPCIRLGEIMHWTNSQNRLFSTTGSVKSSDNALSKSSSCCRIRTKNMCVVNGCSCFEKHKHKSFGWQCVNARYDEPSASQSLLRTCIECCVQRSRLMQKRPRS